MFQMCSSVFKPFCHSDNKHELNIIFSMKKEPKVFTRRVELYTYSLNILIALFIRL